MTEADLLATPVGFMRGILGMNPYPWQETAVTWFERAVGNRLKASLCSPNGAGKDSIVIAGLALWWIFVHPRGRVVITAHDSKQIDEQTEPALRRYRSKLPSDWKWIEREVETPTGGIITLFSTDDERRCEGFHKEVGPNGKPTNEGPLLLIANEAKSLADGIFTAFDRCTYDGLLYASSPGKMSGRFYDSQFRAEQGFRTMRVGLLDCPHKSKEQIADIVATYGEDAPFTRSTLYGEFMEAEGELRYDREGLKRLSEMSTAHEKRWRTQAKQDGALSVVGELVEHDGSRGLTWLPDAEAGWLWNLEGQHPTPGCRYLGWCDPSTGAQAEGAKTRDLAAAGILRLAYVDESGPQPVEHNDEIVAVLHQEGGVLWDNDILAERFALVLKHFKCPAVVEMNNAGMEVIRMLQQLGCEVCRRKKRDHRNPGKLLDVVGFQTTSVSKSLWVSALGTAIREQTFDCRYPLAVSHFSTFIRNEKGTGEAQSGAHDDFVTGCGLGLLERNAATVYRAPVPPRVIHSAYGMHVVTERHQHGALA